MSNAQQETKLNLQSLLDGPVYQAYSYSYPHKTAYRPFPHPKDIETLWQEEKKDALFLYLHIPFCQMRCGFCNLFTLVRPDRDLPDLYLDALERQISQYVEILPSASFSRFAIGGGTPSYLTTAQLERLFLLSDRFSFAENTPIAIETSPDTVDREKVQLLAQRGVSRISMGVQSYTSSEIHTLARMQSNQQIDLALDTIRSNSSAMLNLDLIYGIAGQTAESWLHSLQQALRYKPEELYLYPLYVREKTGLDVIEEKRHIASDLGDNDRLGLYRAGREFLLSEGYEQISMRLFRRKSSVEEKLPLYSCQQDGMLGLGAGARSYTKYVHYSSEYAVGRSGIKDIIRHYVDTPKASFAYAHYGFELNQEEQKRRYLIQSLLINEGIDTCEYKRLFAKDCLDDCEQIRLLIEAGLAKKENSFILLTEAGFERADSIGPWLGSYAVKSRMSDYILR